MTAPLVIWRLADGKRGHDNQSLGLLEALARLTPCEGHDLPLAHGSMRLLCRALAGKLPPRLPAPQLLIGAGHATHLPLIALARASRAPSVVLMQPSLPVSLFSFCLIPEHDRPRAANNVLRTRGALNRIHPATRRRSDLGFILIGGPSRHHAWDSEALVAQIRELISAQPQLQWQAGGSRRTPAQTLERLRSLDGLEVHAFADTTPEWLPAMLAECTQAWVSADSVSMAFEAASSGTATGILAVPAKSPGSRVERAQQQLVDDALAIRFEDWRTGTALNPPPEPLQEAERCARWLLARLGMRSGQAAGLSGRSAANDRG